MDSLILEVSSCTGINEISGLDNQVQFYPNPFGQDINVNIAASGPVTIKMFNTLGEQINIWHMGKGYYTILTKNIPTGVYYIQVKTVEGTLTKKLFKIN